MRKLFDLSAKLIVNDSDIDKAFGWVHKSVMDKMKNSVSEDFWVWVYADIIAQGNGDTKYAIYSFI